MFRVLTNHRLTLLLGVVAAATIFALVAMSSSASAQTPVPAAPKATATATAAAPKSPAPGKTGNAGIAAMNPTGTGLVVGLVVVAGLTTLLARRATRSR